MRIISIISILLFSTWARADFVAGFGLQGGPFESENKNDDDLPVLKTPLLGIRAELEGHYSFVSAFGSFDYSTGTGRAQYDYTNPDDSDDAASAENLRAQTSLSRITLGARLRFINFKRFRIYVGGGIQHGFLSLTYDKDHFKEKNSNTTGFEESERKTLRGYFGEAGVEAIFNSHSGGRFAVRRTISKTEKFTTLGDEKLKFDQVSFAVSFIQYVDMD